MTFDRLMLLARAIMDGSENEIDLNTVTLESRLDSDLCLNSIAMLMLVMAIEDEFRIQLPMDKAGDCVTVGDVVSLIDSCLK